NGGWRRPAPDAVAGGVLHDRYQRRAGIAARTDPRDRSGDPADREPNADGEPVTREPVADGEPVRDAGRLTMQLTSRDKKLIYVLAAALVVLFYLFVLKGGGGGEPLTGPIGGVPPVAIPTVSPSPTPRETLPPVVLAGARDPFSIPPLFQTASAIP